MPSATQLLSPEPTVSEPRTIQSRRGAAARARDAVERNAFVIFALGACAAVGAALLRGEIGLDSWYSLVAGRLIARNGIPHHDTLTSLSLGHTWVDQQWLAHLMLYWLWAAGGWSAALLSDVVIYTASFAVLATSARRLGASERSTAIVAIPCFLVGLSNTVYRAQIPSYLLFALVLGILLADARRPSRRVYLVLPLLVLWANIHGSVVLGAALVGLAGVVFTIRSAGRRMRPTAWLPRTTVLVLAPWLCVLASPYGLALPGYYRSVLGNHELVHASSEWAASTLRGQPLFFALLLGGALIAGAGRRALEGFGALALGLTAVMGLEAVRDIVWFAFTAAAVLPAALDILWPPQASVRRPRLNLALVVVSAALALGVAASELSHGNAWFLHPYPKGALAAVETAAGSNPKALIFANERYADWLLFEDPALAGRIAYDTRYELLTTPQLEQIVSFRKETGLDWQSVVRPYRLLVLDPGGDPGAVSYFEGQPGTRVLYDGPNAIVLRQGP
jgi:hypothetical protein